ncbi:NADH:ubiquinone oxidoreductase subunit [Xylona heveae TC161]|uniref:NADH:ubiquinone oxidoreductase subunit n=1 Tax=Xylona heveae (strain CBS 132557 / TC161) TaxID=1328760 RepID=A0A165GF19_XYLHT|nr:NADH:ubiquinone oxidoreductase subunit [Xylona heveae TC161]KZF22109.1 NADH:ubiquinone oxidoreductase subunit [Xylona heveae TC161]
MLSRRILGARPLAWAVRPAISAPQRSLPQIRCLSQADVEDPGMNGGYINPPAEKRQMRDPYGDWWDKQERRNYGEPVHEDNDILGIFSLEEYTHFTPGRSLFLVGCFIAATVGLCGVVYKYYPDKPATPRTFPNGLEVELGGPNALRARKEGEDQY